MKDAGRSFVSAISLIATLFLFFLALDLMSGSFKLMGRGLTETLLASTKNPFVGLFIGVLATSIIQSSSTTTSLVVGLVAGGGLTVSGAIPIIMGANVGTSVTNTIVSLGHLNRREEFSNAVAGATVHDFFNLLTIAVILPLELIFGILTKISSGLLGAVSGAGGLKFLSPLKAVVDPVATQVEHLLGDIGWIVLIVGVVLLFVALRLLVRLLRKTVMGRSEMIIHKYLFGKTTVALAIGALLTLLVQSSSVTTSVVVPLVAAGVVSVTQIFPFVLGANIGTTMTALLAALLLASSGEPNGQIAVQVALAHLAFNVLGILIFLPIPFMRNIPIRMSEWLGTLSSKNRSYAIIYVLSVFFIIPLIIIGISELIW